MDWLFGKKEKIEAPKWQPDPYYGKSQDALYGTASGLLNGTPNSYYSPIGEWGGKALEDIIGLGSRDISNSVESSLASKGMARSGLSAEAIGSKVGDMSTKLRWEDYNRALTGRQNLLQFGLNSMSGVRSGALQNQDMMNQYDMNASKMDYQIGKDTQDNWAGIISSVIGAGASLYGMSQLGGSMKQQAAPTVGTMGGLDWLNPNWDSKVNDTFSGGY